jgi:cytochrome b subunit of formate dehydrogenase
MATSFYSRGRLVGSLVALVVVLGLAWARLYALTIEALMLEGSLRVQKLLSLSPASLPWWRELLALLLDAIIIVVAVIASVWVVSRFILEAREAGRWRLYYRSPEAKQDRWVERFTLGQRLQYLWGLLAIVALYVTSLAAHLDLADRALALTLHVYSGAALGVLIVIHTLYYGVQAVAAAIRGEKVAEKLPLLKAYSGRYVKDFLKALVKPANQTTLQHYGKYDLGQLFEYWVIYWSLVVAGVTGILLAAYGPAVLDGVAWVVHWRMAVLVPTVVLLMHVGYDHFRPRTFPIDTTFLHGRIPLKRVREEYPGWAVQLEKEKVEVKAAPLTRQA